MFFGKPPIGPLHKVLDVWQIGVAAIVLPPGEFALKHANIDGRHLLRDVIIAATEIASSEQPKCWLRRDRGHEAALLIEPIGVASFGNPITDERQPRRAQRDQLVCIDRQVIGGSGTK